MEQAEDAAVVDIMDCVAKLRHKRCYMVQTLVCGHSLSCAALQNVHVNFERRDPKRMTFIVTGPVYFCVQFRFGSNYTGRNYDTLLFI